MESLTFCKAGTTASLTALDISSLRSGLAENYPAAVAALPLVHLARTGGAQVNGFACGERVGGVFVQPGQVVLGLRAWDDALEGVLADETPWVLFEAEKVIRMMLRQSGLALEILAGRGAPTDFDPRVVIRKAITRDIVLTYRDVTRLGVSRLLALVDSGGLDASGVLVSESADGGWLRDLFRNLLTGAVLGQQGHVCVHLEHLLNLQAGAGVREALEAFCGGETAAIRELGRQAVRLQGLLEVEQARILPERPSDYEGLNDWLVAQRLVAGNLVAGNLVGRRNGS